MSIIIIAFEESEKMAMHIASMPEEKVRTRVCTEEETATMYTKVVIWPGDGLRPQSEYLNRDGLRSPTLGIMNLENKRVVLRRDLYTDTHTGESLGRDIPFEH
jgi:hypothetical protein